MHIDQLFLQLPFVLNVYDQNLIILELNKCLLSLIIYLYYPIIKGVWLTLKAVKCIKVRDRP